MPSSPFAAQLLAFETLLGGDAEADPVVAPLTPWVDADLPFRRETPDIDLESDSAANNRLFEIEAEQAPPLDIPNEPQIDWRGASRRFTLKIRYDGQLDRVALRTRIASDDDQIIGLFQSSGQRVTNVRVVTCIDGTIEPDGNYMLRRLTFEVLYTAPVST